MAAKSFVQDIFSRVSSRYDVMNDVMSLRLHRWWKKHFVQTLPLAPGASLLDVATGTGDIVRLILERSQKEDLGLEISALDPNPEMLRAGQARMLDLGILHPINWALGSAEALPYADETFDCYTIAFGLRNVEDRAAALAEAFRVLKPGGHFACLEFSHVENPVAKAFYKMYSSHIIPKMGKYVAGDEAAYQYLVDSIRAFPPQEALKAEIQGAGFQRCSFENLALGVVAIHRAWRE